MWHKVQVWKNSPGRQKAKVVVISAFDSGFPRLLAGCVVISTHRLAPSSQSTSFSADRRFVTITVAVKRNVMELTLT